MKVLVSGYHNPHFDTITEYIEKALGALGHEVIVFDDRSFMLPGRLHQWFSSLKEWDVVKLNQRLLSLVEETRPDVFLITGGHRILSSMVDEIKSRGVKTILWTIDAPIDFDPVMKVAAACDHVFCGGTEAQTLLSQKDIRSDWLPFAFDEDCLAKQKDHPEYDYDLVFVGSYYHNRAAILAQLTHYRLAIYGPGWDRWYLPHKLKQCIKGKHLKSKEWRDVYQRSKIVLMIHFHQKGIPCHQASPKVYEILGSDSFMLCDYQADAYTLFKHGHDAVFFRDIHDLKEKIDFYLHQEGERRIIASNGFKTVEQKHLYRDRVDIIIKRAMNA